MMQAEEVVFAPGKEALRPPGFRRIPPSESGWFRWCRTQLEADGTKTTFADFPNPSAPHWPSWEAEIDRCNLDKKKAVVAHSAGAGAILRFMSENPDVEVDQMILIATSQGLNWPDREFFNYRIDPRIAERASGLTVMSSTNDFPAIQASNRYLRKTLVGARFVEFVDYGHFDPVSMGTDEFPEILDILRGSDRVQHTPTRSQMLPS